LYHVVNEAGAFDTISAGLAGLTGDSALQAMVLAWVFASFLQGVTGFGVPVAVVAPLLVGLGFGPVVSVVAASIGHAWAVSFGSVATSVVALQAVTRSDPRELVPAAAAILVPACLACGFLALRAAPGRVGARTFGSILVVGTVMGAIQYAAASSRAWPVSAFVAAAAGLGAAWIVIRLTAGGAARGEAPPLKSLLTASSAYLVLMGIVLVQLAPVVAGLLDSVGFAPTYPATATGLGWHNAASTSRRISPFGQPGALILYAAVVSFVVYRAAGWLPGGSARVVAGKTVRAAAKPTVAVVSLVALAAIMSDSGMTAVLARALAQVAGDSLPAFAPLLGAIAAFASGSNTNSNLILGPVVEEAARASGVSRIVSLAAVSAGGAIGSVLSPAKLVVGASTVGLSGSEGVLLRRLLVPGLAVVGVLSVTAALWARMDGGP
jgi:lactate permease